MAVVGGALLDKFIGTSEAEKAFQPWWDTVEDFLVYGLIMLGKIQIEITIKSKYLPMICSHYEMKTNYHAIFRLGRDANNNVQRHSIGLHNMQRS